MNLNKFNNNNKMTTAITIELYNKVYDKDIQILNLSYNQINNVCSEIGQLLNLRELYLDRNQITNVCPEIGKLLNLRVLYLYNNQINNVCPEIGQLLNLHELYLSDNQITNICPEIGRLQNLQVLHLDNNHINNVCPEIGQLLNLCVLYLYNNQINNVCPEIWQLLNLHELYLSDNQINNVCPEIERLQNLQILDLSHNQINNVCSEIGHLINLRKLYLNDNQITIIPANIIQCNNLIRIDYHNNNIEHYIPCVQRFLNRIRNTITMGTIYNNTENVHTSSIQTSVKNSIFNLLNANYEINEINEMNEMDEINNYINDSVLTIKTKQLITEYIALKETHSQLDCTFEEIFKGVWSKILTFEINTQNEVKKRLNEEMADAECKCYTGRISRLVNCLSGYTDKVSIKITDSEQIGNIISHIKRKYTDSSIGEIKQIVIKELTERKFDDNIIEEWISYID